MSSDPDVPELNAIAYHGRTKHSPQSVRSGGHRLDFDNKPIPYNLYTDLPREALPDGPPEPELPALDAITVDRAEPPDREPFVDVEPADIDRETLAQLCFYAAGETTELQLRDRTAQFRAAACTGALYHVDLYPVCGDLDDLDAGVYHYDPKRDSLDVLRQGDYRGVLAAASGDPHVAEAPVTIATTSTWWRNAWKYRERTFRHAFWDSGTVVANLLATAHAGGLAASVVLGFADDAVVDLLGVDPTDEAPLELVPIGADAPIPDPEAGDSSTADRAGDATSVSAETVDDPDVLEPIDPETEPLSPDPQEFSAIVEAWRAGTLPDGDAAADWRRTVRMAASVGTRALGTGEHVPLDPVDRETASARPLGNTIVRRGSCRSYEREPISFRKLSTVLDRAVRGTPLAARLADVDVEGSTEDDEVIDPAVDTCPDLPSLAFCDAYLVVNAVDGLDPGTYHYHPDGDADSDPAAGTDDEPHRDAGVLERLREGAFRQEAGHLALDQQLGADAAVCVYFMTDLEAVVDALGDRGYRLAQFEASLTAGRLYLATYAHRTLGGTGLTFYDDVVTDFFEPRAQGQTPLFLYTMGRPE